MRTALSLAPWTRRAGRLALALAGAAAAARAQGVPDTGAAIVRLTREQAVSLALARGPQAAIAGATARSVRAGLLTARALPNPLLSASYTKDVPQYHATLEFPLDFLWLRSLRVRSAASATEAARYRLAFARAAVRLDVDTLYTRAAAMAAHAALSQRNAADAESLLTIARARRDAGDASDLDVELARVNAGQTANAAAADSIGGIAALLDLQAALGRAAEQPSIALADSLAGEGGLDSLERLAGIGAPAGTPLSVAAAQRDLATAEESLVLEHRNVWSGVAVTAGFDTHDPTSAERGLLPTVGVSVPLPLVDHRRGEIALATANRDLARARLELARRESELLIGQTRRALAVALARARRDRALVASAQRVAAMALRAYAEGAYPLASVLEAQRSARDALGQLIDDTVAARNAAGALGVYGEVAR